jgi:hypothetical protein
MMLNKIEVFHIDDEIQTVDWIPDDLYEALCAKFPRQVSREQVASSDPDHESTLKISIATHGVDRPFEVIYRLMASDANLEEYLKAGVEDDDSCRIFVLDVMHDESGDTGWGIEVYKRLRARRGPLRTEECFFFLTAYPNKLWETLNSSIDFKSQVITKPVTTQLTNVLMERIDQRVNPKSR